MKSRKMVFGCLLVMMIFLIGMVIGSDVKAEEQVISGECGTQAVWNLETHSGILTISGTGKMKNYTSYADTPWWEYEDQIKKIVIEQGITSIGTYSFGLSYVSDIVIPDSVTLIMGYALTLGEIEQITFPETIEDIRGDVLTGSVNLKNITIKGQTPGGYYTEDGVLYQDVKAEKFLLCYPSAKEGADFVVPSGVTDIDNFAFVKLKHLTTIVIPQTVKRIGENGFTHTNHALTFILHNDVENIGYAAMPFYRLGDGTKFIVSDSEKKTAMEKKSYFNKLLKTTEASVEVANISAEQLTFLDGTTSQTIVKAPGETYAPRWRQMPFDTTENVTWSYEVVGGLHPEYRSVVDEFHAMTGAIKLDDDAGKVILTGMDQSGHKLTVTVYSYVAYDTAELMMYDPNAAGSWTVLANDENPNGEIVLTKPQEIEIIENIYPVNAYVREYASWKLEGTSVSLSDGNGSSPFKKLTPVEVGESKLIFQAEDGNNGMIERSITVRVMASALEKTPTSEQSSNDSTNLQTETQNMASTEEDSASQDGFEPMQPIQLPEIPIFQSSKTQKEKNSQKKIGKTKIVNVKNQKKRSLTIRWKKVNGASGYVIYRSPAKNGTYKKVKTITKGKTVFWRDKKLKKGKVYYYKIRVYRKVKSGKTKVVYSHYSAYKGKKVQR